jgi:hypothetical protein|tara:strand:+ start:290 stop:1057 length:768 start_codon:yes stop_codon:yes gene_type:complete
MAIDLKKMRAKLEAMQSKGKGSSNWWKPSDGEQSVRIVPTPDGDPFKEHWFHYNVGNSAGFMCPKKNFNEECAVCSFVEQLWKEANKGDEESKKLARDMGAKQRFFSPVLVRGEEKEGIRVWGYGKVAYQSLLQLVLNPDYGDITDPEEGTDLNIRYGKPPGAQYPVTDIMPARKVSKICPEKTSEECKDLLNTLPDMDTLFEKLSSADVQKKLDEYFSDDDSAEDRSKETTKYSEAAKPKTASSVEEAFADLTR